MRRPSSYEERSQQRSKPGFEIVGEFWVRTGGCVDVYDTKLNADGRKMGIQGVIGLWMTR